MPLGPRRWKEHHAVARDPELPIEGHVEIPVPIDRLWEAFSDVRDWPTWNPCFWTAHVRGERLERGAKLVWAFNPIKPWYLYKMPATARIVECDPGRKVTWEVTAFPGFHARHSYLLEDLGAGRSRFGSWEVAEGPTYRLTRRFWLAHFRYVCRSSLEGASSLAGRRVQVRRFGAQADTGRPPLVAIPGIDGSPASIEPIVRRLGDSRPVLVADYRAEVNPTLERLTDEIAEAVAPEVGGGPVDVLGQSIGTVVAAQLAIRKGLDVRRVVLIGPFTRLDWPKLRLSNLMTRLSPQWLYRLSGPPLMAYECGPVGDGWRHPFFAATFRSDPEGVIKRTRWEIGRDFAQDLERIDLPGLVLIGAKDRFVPDPQREVERLRSLFVGKQVRVEVVPEAGHVLLPTTAIERAAREIEAFLA